MSAGVLRPRRDGLAEALACVVRSVEPIVGRVQFARDAVCWWHADTLAARWPLTITDPAEAWEALAARGVIPLDAVEHPRRWWSLGRRCGMCEMPDHSLDGCGHCMWRRAPRTVAAAVVFAADWPNVLAAEAIAREAFDVDDVVWRVAPAHHPASALVAFGWHDDAGRHHQGGPDEPGPVRDLCALGYEPHWVDAETRTAWLTCPAIDDGAPAGAGEERGR